ncbi:hypothetical protein PIB30_029428 [Stylosanthes scabra]|uniref:Uncharacterized protein n=1 Tax=Stylosanthes scabra TaxID=79078 RepID=A0ABU6X8Y2_9FABA|nr:hypothetical protein [Stylosanthes scabra]
MVDNVIHQDISDEDIDHRSNDVSNYASENRQKRKENVHVKSRSTQSKYSHSNKGNKYNSEANRNPSTINTESKELMKVDHKEAHTGMGNYGSMSYTDILSTAHRHQNFQHLNDLPMYPGLGRYPIPPYHLHGGGVAPMFQQTQSHPNVPTYYSYWNAHSVYFDKKDN